MARKAKKKAKAKKRSVKRVKARTAKSAKKTRRRTKASTPKRAAAKSQRKQREPIPAEPAGRIGLRRPSNEPRAPGPREPQELAKTEPNARFGDLRDPENTAREISGGNDPRPDEGYKNTDERF